MPEAPPALIALIETGVSLARRSSSGKLLFGRLNGVVHADLLPERIRRPRYTRAPRLSPDRIDSKTERRAGHPRFPRAAPSTRHTRYGSLYSTIASHTPGARSSAG